MTILKHNNIEQLSEALPSSFNFYHLGKVELQPEELQPDLQLSTHDALYGISFHLRGDLHATLVILLGKNLDLALYSELGNILASKIANQLFVDRQLQIEISPPQLLSENQLASILESGSSTTRKTYVHRYENKIFYLETLFVPSPLEGIGNA